MWLCAASWCRGGAPLRRRPACCVLRCCAETRPETLGRAPLAGITTSDGCPPPPSRSKTRGTIKVVPLRDTGVLQDEARAAELLTEASGGSPFDLLVFNCGAFDPQVGVVDMRQADATLRRHLMDLHGYTVGAAAAAQGTQRFLYTSASTGLGQDDAMPPSWWCDYCTAGKCPAVWGCCSRQTHSAGAPLAAAGQASLPADTPAAHDSSVMGTVSVSDPAAPWTPPPAEVVATLQQQGEPGIAAAGASTPHAHSLGALLSSASVAGAGTCLAQGGTVQQAETVATFSGLSPSASTAVPAPDGTVQDIEAALREAVEGGGGEEEEGP